MAYQKELSSIHASFNLQEPIRHYIERNSDVIVVLLDSTKAFDTVWHDALLYKLHKYGVTGDLWLLIDEIYSDSEVLWFNGRLSRWFELKRGVRPRWRLIRPVIFSIHKRSLCDIEDSKLGCVLSRYQCKQLCLPTTLRYSQQQKKECNNLLTFVRHIARSGHSSFLRLKATSYVIQRRTRMLQAI
ncbi:unnamed protein product [Mytilus edulis]|uniref:Reverse transcriptase domain-containing protein n=1 Tax=Mytilus edulis TaxID=6550 RepID=A0A8S3Q5X2_MYTED|nr:unnamed protein product [Mytilus edulis]